MTAPTSFEHLSPDCILTAVETTLGEELTGLTAPLPSYINRVYELQAHSGERFIAKFYRPGRWSREMLQEEHDFVLDCAEMEIPVVAPLDLDGHGSTIAEYEGMMFALFPKRSGREMELQHDEGWRRLGRLIGRIHLAGQKRDSNHRLVMHPASTTAPELKMLTEGGFMSARQAERYHATASKIIDRALVEFEGIDLQRIHGDCHRGNILERPDDGIMIIDFDDMMTGPAVQDIWLLLPDHANQSRHEINLILEGYEQFMEFDDRQLRLIEILRAMRIIYFLSWCGTQVDDARFRTHFPEWGSDAFWEREITDLDRQYHVIMNDERLNGERFV